MLVHQAALALERWTGRAVPVEAMWAAVRGAPGAVTGPQRSHRPAAQQLEQVLVVGGEVAAQVIDDGFLLGPGPRRVVGGGKGRVELGDKPQPAQDTGGT